MTAVLPALIPSWGRPANTPQRRRTRQQLPHVLLAAAFFALYATISAARYYRADAASWDLGIFTQAVRGWATHAAPIADIKGPGYNLLGDHWSPILALLAPAWWVWPSPVMLLTAQAALFAWSAGIVSDTAARFLHRGNGLLIGVGYGLSFGLQQAVNVEFHEIASAVPLLALSLRQLLLRRWHRAAYWALPLLLVKEDLGLTVAVIGALIWWLGRDRLYGAGTVLLGLAGTAVEVTVLIPAFNPHHHYDYLAMAPHGGHHSVWWWAGWQLSQVPKWHTLLWLAAVGAFTGLRSSLALVVVPSLGWRMLATNPFYWDTFWHYNAVLMPVLFLATVDGIERLRGSRRPGLRSAGHQAPAVIAAIGVATCCAWPLPAATLADRGTWQPNPWEQAVKAAARLVPSGSTVESWHPGLASLAARCTVFWIGGDPRPPSYALLTPGDRNLDSIVAFESGLHGGARYRMVFERDGVALLRLDQSAPTDS